MFEKKKLWMVLATAALVTACGGGSSGGGDTGGGNPPPGGGNDPDPIVSDDTTLVDSLSLANNHVLYGAGYQELGAFQGNGLYGADKGPNGAPFNAVGFRIDPATAGGDARTPNDEAVGRLGISLTEQAESAGTETAEAMQIIVNGVRMATNDSNVVSANLIEGATMIVAGTTASGEAVGPIEVAIPETAVRVAPSADYVGGDEYSSVLVFDMAQAFGELSAEQAASLEGLAALQGRFATNITLSAANILGGDGAVLEGAEIAVPGSSTAAPVSGSGASGNICIAADELCAQ